MHLSPFTPLVVAVVTPMVLALAHRDSHLEVGRSLIYRYSPGLAYFILLMSLALALLLGFLPQSRAVDHPVGRLVMLAFATNGAVWFTYIHRFRIIIRDDAIRVGAFFPRTIPFSEIEHARYVQGQQSGQLILRSKSGTKVSIWETINDFGSCARAIDARLPEGISLPDTGRIRGYLRHRGTDQR